MKVWLGVAVAAGVAGCGPVQNTAVDLASLPPGKALIILRVTEASPDSTFELSTYDTARQRMTSSPLSGFQTFDLADTSDQGFLWKQVDPGTYVLASFTHQHHWALCFAHQSEAFTVQAGQRLYLGTLDTPQFSQALSINVDAHGDRRIDARFLKHYFDGIPPVHTEMEKLPLNPDGTVMLSSTGSVDGVENAVMVPASFKPGYTLYGQPICGGYFR